MEMSEQERINIERKQMQHITQDKEMLQQRFQAPQADTAYLLSYQSAYYKAEKQIIQNPANNVVPAPGSVVINEEAPAATVQQETREYNKKEKEYIKTNEKILEQYNTHREAALKVIEHNRRITNGGLRSTMPAEEHKDRKELLSEDLKSIDLFRQATILQAENDGKYNESTKLSIDWKAQSDRAKVYERYACSLPLESKERAAAMKDRENAEKEAAKLKRQYNASNMENPVQKAKEKSAIRWHAIYDASKAFFKFFKKKDNSLSKTEAKFRVTDENEDLNGHLLVNTGQAHMGGTKPMYIFEDRTETDTNGNFKQYIYKEAVSRFGISEGEDAAVTEAASKLQEELRPGRNITAFAVRQNGKLVGSFQEKIDVMKDGEQGKVDLFSWQANPQDTLSRDIKREIMEEHVLDWVLCNFDTKGEDLVQENPVRLHGSDKEESLKYLFSSGAQEMSTTYKPNSDDSIYNVLYSQFAQGKIDLDLEAVTIPIIRLKRINDDAFINMMEPAIDEIYKDEKKRANARTMLLKRKTDIEGTYKKFFTELLKQREAALRAQNKPMDHLDEMEPNTGKFLFRSDRIRRTTV